MSTNEHNKLWNPDTYTATLNFATIAHGDQAYKSPIPGVSFPYINHLARVAMEICLALANSPEKYDGDLAVQCALLHDVLEDTECTAQKLEVEFGQSILAGVAALTKRADLPKPEAMADSLQRIKQQPKEIWMVKMADRINNLSEPPFHWDDTKICAYQQEAEQIHQALHSANEGLAHRLQERITAYSQYLGRS